MGNSQGREARGPQLIDPNDPEVMRRLANGENVYGNRHGHSSQVNLNIFAHRDREREGPQDEAALAARRETKAEREAKRIEKERAARERERERSMREESVDGGYLVTQGVYTGVEDYNKSIVRTLMIDRRIAPFWPGLDDHSGSWAEHQLIAAVHKRPIPEPDEPPKRSPAWPPADGPRYLDAGEQSSLPPPSNAPVISSNLSSSPASASGLLKGRGKGAPSLTVPGPAPQGGSQTSLLPREITLPAEPLVNGQRLEVYLYKDASECPICFLYYPPHLNRTRCCDQPICSECFVQIKRPDPHVPEHHNDSNNPTAEVQIQQEQEADLEGGNLVSEPAQCPYCAQPEFGITFEPPPIRRGLVYANAVSSTPSPMPSPTSPTMLEGRKRAASLPATATTVITTDKVRPEWSNKLATARAHAARRSAAATALHTAAYMMGGRQRRFLPSFGRGSSSRNLNNEDGAEGAANADESGQEDRVLDINALMRAAARDTTGQSPAGQRTSSRRTRIEEVENMMMLEAIRLSLAAEEERRKKEDKERQKEDKKKAKEDKKAQKEAQKAARKASGSSSNLYGMLGASRSNLTVNSSQQSTFSQDSVSATPPGKGKALDRERSNSNPQAAPSPAGASQSADAQAHLERSRANLQPVAEAPSVITRPSHLRSLSNASSTSSLGEPSPSLYEVHDPRAVGGADDSLSTTPTGGTGTEPMLNYASIMDMIEREQRENEAETAGQESATDAEKTSNSATHQEQSQPDIGNGNGHASSHTATSKHNVAVMSGPMQNEPLR